MIDTATHALTQTTLVDCNTTGAVIIFSNDSYTN